MTPHLEVIKSVVIKGDQWYSWTAWFGPCRVGFIMRNSSLLGDEGGLEWVDNIRLGVELACLSAALSFASLAAPEEEKGETWRRFGSMSCIPGRSERLDLRLGRAMSLWIDGVMIWGVDRGG